MTVDELLTRISSEELVEWYVRDRILQQEQEHKKKFEAMKAKRRKK